MQLVFAHVVQTPPVVQVEEPHQENVHDDQEQLRSQRHRRPTSIGRGTWGNTCEFSSFSETRSSIEPIPTKNAYQLYDAIAFGLKMSRKIISRESLLVETPQKFLSWLAAMLNAEPVVKAVITVSERMFVTKPRRSTPRDSRKIPLTAEVVIMVNT